MLLYYIKKFKKIMLLSGVASLFTASASIALFHMIGESGHTGFQPLEMVVFGILVVFLLAASMATSYFLSQYSSGTVNSVRQSLIKRILRTDYGLLEKAGRARLYNVLTNDVNAISGALAEMPAFIYNSFLLIACFGYLFVLSELMFGILVVTALVSFLVTRVVMAKITRAANTMREHQDDVIEGYKGILDGAKQLTVNKVRREHFYEQRLQPVMSDLRVSEREYGFAWDINRNISQVLIFITLGTIVAVNQYLQSTELVMSYILIVTYISAPFGYVMNLWQNIARAKVSLQKIESLQLSAEQVEQSDKLEAKSFKEWDHITFKDVSFTYDSDGEEAAFSLPKLNLTLNKGEVLFITGGNGSGKSTFLHLLLGLYSPSNGFIKVDDFAVTESNLDDYRSKITMVLPDFYLYKELLDDDGHPVDLKKANMLLEQFQLSHKLSIDQTGFTATKFSQGQRKRLALISSILEDKDIYVLDEWAADQDPHFRAMFYKELLPRLKAQGKTVIAVTHDDKYFHLADRHIKFDQGNAKELLSDQAA
ncbi:cyclic peptide export ABC transporter [Pseudoalteromonas aurantia]|uniref:Cyclic peptide export ABC transporter n=1 Tax=Pseudoalteromonas aurantia TaxID=43654 RepID=A0A5S3VEN2_9GAMM|nr:cyclic peptide export ABC transporter [Pseudoalteromonas aurantia]TMO70668.1 cyclic peptide export ABC transporter [Pseudoalteromonas aurantia]